VSLKKTDQHVKLIRRSRTALKSLSEIS
jgi:hypothetical protein